MSKFEEVGAVTGDLGLSTLKLAKFEDTDGSNCGSYTDSAMASKNISADTKRVGSVRFPGNGCFGRCVHAEEDASLWIH